MEINSKHIEQIVLNIGELIKEEEKEIAVIEEKIENYRKLIEKLLNFMELNEESLTWDDIKTVMTLTCYDNFAGCCAPEKGCLYQFTACQVLGIDPKELYNIKCEAVKKYIKKILA